MTFGMPGSAADAMQWIKAQGALTTPNAAVRPLRAILSLRPRPLGEPDHA